MIQRNKDLFINGLNNTHVYNIMEYKYTKNWFLGSEIKNKLSFFLNSSKENKILEIGCFEGLSSVFFADHVMDHPISRLTCVDPFLTIDTNDHGTYLQNNEELNFDFNISNCKNSTKIKINKVTSDSFFATNNETYNFIYIDGCHEPDFITRDMENSFRVLDQNGIMWMDDYKGTPDITNTMNTFLEKYKGQFKIIHVGYQLAIQKCNRVAQMHKIQQEGLELFTRKNVDYGDAFAKYGVIGVLMRIEDKLQRSISITKNGVNLVKDEGIRDTLIDLHNYAAMALILLDE